MTAEVQRDLGRMEGEMSSIKRDMAELKKDVKAIRETLSEAKGGWRVMLMISGISATVGGLVAKFLPWLMSGPK